MRSVPSRPGRPVVARRIAVLAVLLLAALAGCTSDSRQADGRVQVEASFYPLEWMAERVGGAHVEVVSLTKPGAEPHDLELSPRDVAAVEHADIVVYLRGFQPAVDTAVADTSGPVVFDAAPAARLDRTFSPIEGGRKAASNTVDPHFWLDPPRLVAVARSFAVSLTKHDPSHAAAYRRNLAALAADLGRLDAAYRTGLASCQQRDLVTSHNAFGYLAARYGLRQVGIAGLTPEQEPSARQLAAVSRYVERHHVGTIYFETLASPAVARTVARESGARTAMLDPIEGLDDASQGGDYLQVMRANLTNLRAGQECS